MLKNNNQLPLKPLEEYLNEIKKRNKSITQLSPALEQLYNSVSSYDDLYQKLIEETYYIYNELQLQSIQLKSNANANTKVKNLNIAKIKMEGINDPVKKALLFKSSITDRSKINKSKEKVNNSLSPIPQYAYANRSNDFCITSNNKNKEILFKNSNHQHNTFIGDDLIFLINNSKEIEKLLLTNNNTVVNNNNKSYNSLFLDNIRNSNENIIEKYERKIFKIEKEKNNLIDQKNSLEKELNEIKYLFAQFEWKYANISDMELNNSIREESKMMIVLDSPSSKKINELFSQNLLKEAETYWKQYNYQPLVNFPLDRSYEMLGLLSKLKDRELKSYRHNNQFLSNDNNVNEVKKKNKEIVELLANIELFKSKSKDNENKLFDLKSKLNFLIDDNSILFQENRKLKTLIEIHSKIS